MFCRATSQLSGTPKQYSEAGSDLTEHLHPTLHHPTSLLHFIFRGGNWDQRGAVTCPRSHSRPPGMLVCTQCNYCLSPPRIVPALPPQLPLLSLPPCPIHLLGLPSAFLNPSLEFSTIKRWLPRCHPSPRDIGRIHYTGLDSLRYAWQPYYQLAFCSMLWAKCCHCPHLTPENLGAVLRLALRVFLELEEVQGTGSGAELLGCESRLCFVLATCDLGPVTCL